MAVHFEHEVFAQTFDVKVSVKLLPVTHASQPPAGTLHEVHDLRSKDAEVEGGAASLVAGLEFAFVALEGIQVVGQEPGGNNLVVCWRNPGIICGRSVD